MRRGVRLALQAAAVALLAALIGLFARSLLQGSTTVSAELNDGRRPAAPNFSLPKLDGRGEVALRSFRGKVVVLNFWASWCPPCQEEAPLFNQIQDTYRRRGVAVVGVDSQDFAGDARAFARRLHVDYTLVRDSSNDVTNRWGVTSGFPVTFVIDRSGAVQKMFSTQVDGQMLQSALRPLLGAGSA
ncbi:MAG TPA: TlpA disulfide reductase family protein [Gaiellales bacterium]|nr:TlpA disulfide reductase family protein [Gaiellales bacterium]